jgi:hypothetical protein
MSLRPTGPRTAATACGRRLLERELSEAGFEGFSVDAAGNRWFLVVARKPAAPLQVAKSRGDR